MMMWSFEHYHWRPQCISVPFCALNAACQTGSETQGTMHVCHTALTKCTHREACDLQQPATDWIFWCDLPSSSWPSSFVLVFAISNNCTLRSFDKPLKSFDTYSNPSIMQQHTLTLAASSHRRQWFQPWTRHARQTGGRIWCRACPAFWTPAPAHFIAILALDRNVWASRLARINDWNKE